MAGAKISITHKLTWNPGGGDIITLNAAESFNQAGDAAIERTQDFTDTTTQIELGDVTAPNRALSAMATLYVDQVTPVDPAVAPIKVPPGKSAPIFTSGDLWYGITATGGLVHSVIGAIQP